LDSDRVFGSGFSGSQGGTGFGLSIVGAQGREIRVTESTSGGARFGITGVEFLD